MKTFKIIPILGTKTDVVPDDPSMLQMIDQQTAVSHDAGGLNFDLSRRANACSKAYGQAQRSNSANAQKTLCMGLFQLYDGTNRNSLYFDNGLVYKYDGSWDPSEITVATPVTFANDNADLYSIIRVGAYVVWADFAEHTPYKWKHGDANSSKLIQSGTEYKFRYITSFQRRVIGAYSDQTNGNIDVRWSTAWPATAITSLNYPATNQLYIPNDDPIVGIKVLGRDKCFVFCENSIQQMVYYPDYDTPFRLYTIVPYQGAANHHSIVGREGVLSFYNKDYGFCEYYGGNTITPISDDIKSELKSMNVSYLPLIVGTHDAINRKIYWTVPMGGQAYCDHVISYKYDTRQWEIMNRTTRYLDTWRVISSLTWTDLVVILGGTGATWQAAGSGRWADYISENNLVVYGGTDGHLYTHSSEELSGSNLDGYRVEPVLYFGNRRRWDNIKEIWFDIGLSGDFSIDVYHRTGNTVGELVEKGWTLTGTVSCNNPLRAEVLDSNGSKPNINARLIQIKWGTDLLNESFQVNGITFKYESGSEV